MHRPNCVDVIVFYGSYTNTFLLKHRTSFFYHNEYNLIV